MAAKSVRGQVAEEKIVSAGDIVRGAHAMIQLHVPVVGGIVVFLIGLLGEGRDVEGNGLLLVVKRYAKDFRRHLAAVQKHAEPKSAAQAMVGFFARANPIVSAGHVKEQKCVTVEI